MANFELNVKVNGIEQTVSTIGQLEQALTATNQQLTQVEENSKEFNFLTNQAGNLKTVLGALTTDAQTFNKNLNDVSASANSLNNAITETATIASDLGRNSNVDNLNKEIDQTVKSSTSLRNELRKITLELQNLEPGSARFQELSVRAGELRDQIGDTNAVVSALAGSTAERLGRALSSTVQIGIAGFQGITAGAALFGVETEKLEPTLVKLTALLNLSQALESFGGLGDKIDQISAGFQSLVGATEAATVAANANAAAASAEATATIAAQTATTGAAVANNSNAIANQADAAASLEDAAAKIVETSATNGATVATTALGLAMKALPIVAIIAALATLTYGIYQYVSSNDEAKKQEEARKKRLDELKKAEEEQATAIGKESAEFVGLIYQLKNTNKGSEERKKLIKEINTTYGTTFKNLQDETAFQAQLNIAVEDYINLQYNRYKLDKNAEAFEKAAAKRFDAEQKRAKLLAEFERERFRKGQTGLLDVPGERINRNYIFSSDETLANYRKRMGDFDKQMLEVEKNLGEAENSMNALGASAQALEQKIVNITNNGKKYEVQTHKNVNTNDNLTNSIKELTAAEEFALEITKLRAKISTDQIITQAKATETLIDDIEAERKIELDSLKERFDAAIKKDKDEVDSKKKAASEKTAIENAYNDFLKEVNKNFQNRINEQTQLEIAARKKTNDELLSEYKILQEEIKFGDQNTLDTLEALNQRRLQLAIDQVDAELKNNELSLTDYEALQKGKAELIAAFNINQQKIDIEIAKANKRKDLQNYKELLEGRLKTTFTFNEDQLDAFQQLQDEEIESYGKRLLDAGILEKQRNNESEADFKARLVTEALAFKNIQKTKINLDKEYAIVSEEINTKTNEAIVASDTDATKKVFEIKVQLLQDYLSLASDALSQFSNDALAGYTTLISGSINAISQIVSIQEKEFETSGERISAYAQVVGSLISSVVSSFVTQNQASLQQDLDFFQATTNEKKDALTKQYDQGVIDRQTYDAQIKKLDDALDKQTLDAKQKAFDQDKKLRIAQATIAGLQGIVAAIAGAMQLGPIAGPIVGAALAGTIAALTAAQIAQIRKQKFDSGGIQPTTETTTQPQTPSQQINQSAAGGFTSFNQNLTGAPTSGQASTTPFTQMNSTKVYVLESDITATQRRVQVLENNSTFG